VVLVNAAGNAVKGAALDDLSGAIRGDIITPDDPNYDERKLIWNGFFQKSPGAIVRVDGASDVIKVVNFAREHEIELAIKGGGHCFAGSGTTEGGLLLDTSNLRRPSAWPSPARRSPTSASAA
jgi:FAD/FMN-containing dehydrogenase